MLPRNAPNFGDFTGETVGFVDEIRAFKRSDSQLFRCESAWFGENLLYSTPVGRVNVLTRINKAMSTRIVYV